MRIGAPTNPFHVARAYGVQPTTSVRPVNPVTPAASTDIAGRLGVDPLARLVAARVPGGIDFQTQQPTTTAAGSLPFYRHPADRNLAAVNLEAGRLVDMNG